MPKNKNKRIKKNSASCYNVIITGKNSMKAEKTVKAMRTGS